MTAKIIGFQPLNRSLDAAIFRAVGLPRPNDWRREGRDFNSHFFDGHLHARPHVVGSCRSGELCVISFMRGRTPRDVPDKVANRAVVDAAVVRGALQRRMRVVKSLWIWLVFEDRGRIELRASEAECKALVAHARYVARGQALGLPRADSHANTRGSPVDANTGWNDPEDPQRHH